MRTDRKQVASLEEIAKREKSRDKLDADQAAAADKVAKGITDRDTALSTLEETFNADERVLTDLKFGIESAVPPEVVEHASLGFSQRSTNDYIKNKGDAVSYEDAQADPAKFLNALRGGNVTLNKNYEPSAVAADVLAVTKEVLVANRHGNDRRNKDGRTFEYFTGALEHSKALDEASATTLGRCGIREHACEILDGGEEAFQKRREKHKIGPA